MILERAREILNSPNNIEVLYNKDSIWIESIDENQKIASIKNLENNQIMEVPVSKLSETG